MTSLVLVETVLLAVLCVLVAGLLRAYATVLARLHQLDGGRPAQSGATSFDLLPVLDTPPQHARPGSVRSAAPSTAHDIAGESLLGELITTRVRDVEHDTLLLFLSSGCSSCETFWTQLAAPFALPPNTRLLVVTQSAQDENPAELHELAPDGIDLVLSSQAWTDYEVPGSPHVVFVDGGTGRVRGEGTGQSLHQVSELLTRSTGGGQDSRRPDLRKSDRDAAQEDAVDRELLAAGIGPGDPRLYGDSRQSISGGGSRQSISGGGSRQSVTGGGSRQSVPGGDSRESVSGGRG